MPSTVEPFSDSAATPSVVGALHRPAKPSGHALVLTHGAGADRDWPLLVALAHSLADAGITVLRCDLPFRQQRRSGPPRGDGAEDRAGLMRAVHVIRAAGMSRVFLGGQSYGGRQASMLLADEPGLADGLLLLSYPLHAPARPDQLRTKHLPNIHVPALFVSGSKDPFGSPEEMKSAIRLIPAHTSFQLVEGGGHDLGYGRRPSTKFQDVPFRISQAFATMFDPPKGG
jgi:hypothetical protein